MGTQRKVTQTILETFYAHKMVRVKPKKKEYEKAYYTQKTHRNNISKGTKVWNHMCTAVLSNSIIGAEWLKDGQVGWGVWIFLR